MNTYPETSALSKPVGDEQVALGTFGYFRARNRHRLHSLVLSEFMRSGLTQAVLARRMGKRPDIVCRWLGAPGNWTLDTLSDLLFAISGGEIHCAVDYPLDAPAANYRQPIWLYPESDTTTRTDGRAKPHVTGLPNDAVPTGVGSNPSSIEWVAR